MKKGATLDPEGGVPHVTRRACVLGRFVPADAGSSRPRIVPQRRPFGVTLTIAPDAHTSTPLGGRGPLTGPHGTPVRRTVTLPNSTMIQLDWRSPGGGAAGGEPGGQVSALPATDPWPRDCTGVTVARSHGQLVDSIAVVRPSTAAAAE
jgi:hypothetical protein